MAGNVKRLLFAQSGVSEEICLARVAMVDIYLKYKL